MRRPAVGSSTLPALPERRPQDRRTGRPGCRGARHGCRRRSRLRSDAGGGGGSRRLAHRAARRGTLEGCADAGSAGAGDRAPASGRVAGADRVWQLVRGQGVRAVGGTGRTGAAMRCPVRLRPGWRHRYASELAASERAEVVCHGDPHAGNVLRLGAGWAFIDPDRFVGDAPTTWGVVLRNRAGRSWRRRLSTTARATRCWARSADAWPSSRTSIPTACGAGVRRARHTGLYLRWHGHAVALATFLDTAAVLGR